MRLVVLVLVSLLSSLPSIGVAQSISPELRRDIIVLMESTGALKLGEQMAGAMSQQMAGALRTAPPAPAIDTAGLPKIWRSISIREDFRRGNSRAALWRGGRSRRHTAKRWSILSSRKSALA